MRRFTRRRISPEPVQAERNQKSFRAKFARTAVLVIRAKFVQVRFSMKRALAAIRSSKGCFFV